MRKRTTIYVDDQDIAAIRAIRYRHGLSTASDAIRFAVRKEGRESQRGLPSITDEMMRERAPRRAGRRAGDEG